MDDTNDKLRRNLVVASAAILAAFWVGFRIPSLSTLGGVGVIDDAHAPRVWAAAALMLIYLLGRFHFSEDREKMLTAWSEDREARVVRYMSALAARKEVFDRNAGAKVREAYLNRKRSDGTAMVIRRVSLRDAIICDQSRAGKILYYRTRWSDDERGDFENRYSHSPNSEDEVAVDVYTVGRWRSPVIHVRAIGRSLTWSRGAFDLVVPYVLVVLAISACLHKFMSMPTAA